ncbi:hypothetical protein KIN20_011004 [Parelaphostrongylus tenuis]|uniref:Uncharacterized protein n=1 Tax=Parelaphostrongylus tenuis TaxID=148309 RepID=A0AAD5M8R7_PARTN|nr:hypothetical protein KIN20_011004 [Parelaphostrongylus tenuis]
MCFSMCAQVLYGIVMFCCLALTIGAMFTSNWREITTDAEKQLLRNHSLPSNMGIFPFACRMPGDQNIKATKGDFEYCEKWWHNLQAWEKAVVAAMVLAVLIEAFALAWDIFTWCACCCKQFLLHPLTFASLAASISLAIAVVVYGMNNKSAFEEVKTWGDIQSKIQSEVGYSFWLAVGALGLAVASTFVAACANCLGQLASEGLEFTFSC